MTNTTDDNLTATITDIAEDIAEGFKTWRGDADSFYDHFVFNCYINNYFCEAGLLEDADKEDIEDRIMALVWKRINA